MFTLAVQTLPRLINNVNLENAQTNTKNSRKKKMNKHFSIQLKFRYTIK